MAQIGTVGRVGAVQVGPARGAADRGPTEAGIPAGRALVLLDGGRRERPSPGGLQRDGRPDAGFVTQLLACADPALRPSRLERTRAAADLYAAAARRTG